MLVFLAEAALRLGNVESVRRLRPMVAEYAGLNLVAGQFVAVFGSADRYLGAMDSLLGETSAETGFLRAMEMDAQMRAPVHQAETMVRYAAHQRRVGAGTRRVEELESQARRIAEPLGLARVLRLLEESARRAAPGSMPERPDGLTVREVEVLALLAEGLINREIAERLVISENTAANHVRSILTKTGSGNRTQAAIYAAARGLL